ncbi:hypothetical protein [Streptomyces sp. NBC_00239]|uniref:hypothetical protein n=1 Tax=Streptomyces sp. NBC_00239 TaxID=2903640 RepID=UPI002E2AC4CA|nr:hypothetical protein [Streptomyces sp. NBC_00239]
MSTQPPRPAHAGALDAATPAPAPSLRGHRSFQTYRLGEATALAGSSVSTVALPVIAAMELDATPGQVSTLASAVMAPAFLLALPAGVAGDRCSKTPKGCPVKALLPLFRSARSPLFTALNGNPQTPDRPTGGADLAGDPPDQQADVRTERLLAMARRLLAAGHLRLLAVAEYTVLARLQGPEQYGVEYPAAAFRDDGTIRVPDGPPALRPHPMAGEPA